MRKILVSLAVVIPLLALGDPPQPARFEKSFAVLRAIFAETDPRKIIDQLIAKGRGPLFSIEGLARIYEDQYPETMTSLRDQSKEFEDRLGTLVDLGEHVAYAKEIGASDRVMRLLRKKVTEDREAFLIWLQENKWVDTDDFRLEKWERKVAATDWDGPKKDRRYVLEQLIASTKQLRHNDWDLSELQDGVHDFRRRLRWLSIYSQSLADLMVMDDRTLNRWDAILTEPIASSQYADLPSADKLKFPILLPRALHLELTQAIYGLGNAKNAGEAQYEWLAAALFETGEASTFYRAKAAAGILAQKHSTYAEVKTTARRIYKHLRGNDGRYGDKLDRGVLVALHTRLKQQRDWTAKDCRRALEEE